MKKVILGSTMLLGGLLAYALLLAGSMMQDWMIDDRFSAYWNLSQYGLMPALVLFALIAAAGLAVAVWGVREKK